MNYGVDRYKRPYPISAEEEKRRQCERAEYVQRNLNDLWRTLPEARKMDRDDDICFPSEPQENLLYFIEKNVRRAGYPWDGKGTIIGFQRDKAPSGTFTNSNEMSVEGGGSSDALVMQYRAPAGGATDCTGRNIAADEYIAMHFLIDGGGLKCETSTTDSSFGTALSSAVLINDVTNLQFSYGVDSNKDGIPDGEYDDADDVAADEWDQVVAVRAEATVTVEPAALSDDSTMVFSTTIPIRNQISSL